MAIQSYITNHSFRFKVIFYSILCIVLPVIITLTIYNQLTQDAMKEQAIKNANNELEITDEYVTKLFKDMLHVTNFIQIDTEINAILKERANDNVKAIVEPNYEQFLADQTVMKTIENITLVGERSHVTILLKNEKYYTNYPISDYNPTNMYKEKWFQDLNFVSGYDTVWIGNQPTIFESEKMVNPYQISVVRSLKNGKSETYGYVVVTIFENKINQIFQKRTVDEEMILLDEDNNILSHSDTKQIGKHFPHLELDNKDHSVVNISGIDYLLTTQNLSLANWKLVSLIPYKKAVHKMNAIYKKIFFLQFIAFTVFLILLAYLINRITKPLVHLGKVVSEVQSGNLKVRSNIKTTDEIGRFSRSFDNMLEQVNEMIKRTTEIQKRKRKAELAMLQAQINPHFLFNVLNTIRMKVYRNGDIESSEMINSLSKLLRETIDGHEDEITLFEEVNLIKDYVYLMNMRKDADIILETDISNDVKDKKIPRFILQPMIENSIIHGLDESDGKIHLQAFYEEDYLIIIISDNGKGMDSLTLENLRKNIVILSSYGTHSNKSGFSSLGLSNVYERLFMGFGPDVEIKIDSTIYKGTKITLKIPKHRGEDYNMDY